MEWVGTIYQETWIYRSVVKQHLYDNRSVREQRILVLWLSSVCGGVVAASNSHFGHVPFCLRLTYEHEGIWLSENHKHYFVPDFPQTMNEMLCILQIYVLKYGLMFKQC